MLIQIAIDGPSGAGKSTMAKIVASQKGFLYLDTGAMYRAFGLYAILQGVDFNGSDKYEDKLISLLDNFNLDIKYVDNEQQVFVNGKNVNKMIRTPDVSLAASKVAVVPEVRIKMVEIQRDIAERNNVVMDGRDIGTYVLPNANVKIFLTASAEARATRRFDELKLKGNNEVTYEEVLNDMKFRDQNDSTRAFAPLKKADDAVLLDTTFLDISQSVQKIKELIDEKL